MTLSPHRQCRRVSLQHHQQSPFQLHHLGGSGSDLLEDDANPLLGSMDMAAAARVRMLECGPSSAAASLHSRTSSSASQAREHCAVVSARQLAHGAGVACHLLLGRALLPVTRLSCRVGCAAARATAHTAIRTSAAVVRTAARVARFAMAPRVTVEKIYGPPPQAPSDLYPSSSEFQHPFPYTLHATPSGRITHAPASPFPPDTATSGSARQALSPAPSQPVAHRPRRYRVVQQPPEPLSKLVGARILLRDCGDTRLRVEYCSDCVLVAERLERVELLLVGCTRVKLVLRNCRALVLRELQCSGMGDFVRRSCPGFEHHIVCLRCACKPAVQRPVLQAGVGSRGTSDGSGVGGEWGLGGWAGAAAAAASAGYR